MGSYMSPFPLKFLRFSKVINLEQFGIPPASVIEVISSEPVLVERYIGSSKGGYWTRVLPALSSLSEPIIPFASSPKNK